MVPILQSLVINMVICSLVANLLRFESLEKHFLFHSCQCLTTKCFHWLQNTLQNITGQDRNSSVIMVQSQLKTRNCTYILRYTNYCSPFFLPPTVTTGVTIGMPSLTDDSVHELISSTTVFDSVRIPSASLTVRSVVLTTILFSMTSWHVITVDVSSSLKQFNANWKTTEICWY